MPDLKAKLEDVPEAQSVTFVPSVPLQASWYLISRNNTFKRRFRRYKMVLEIKTVKEVKERFAWRRQTKRHTILSVSMASIEQHFIIWWTTSQCNAWVFYGLQKKSHNIIRLYTTVSSDSLIWLVDWHLKRSLV